VWWTQPPANDALHPGGETGRAHYCSWPSICIVKPRSRFTGTGFNASGLFP
jgi:hypothetical protein